MSRMRYIFILITAVAASLLTACRHTPKEVLGKDDMISLLIDIHKGEGLIDMQRSVYHNDSLRKALKQSVLLAHGVTQEQLDTSFVWYGNHIEEYIEVYDEVIKHLEEEVNAPGAAATTVIYAVGDSIDVWNGSPTYRIDWQLPMKNVPWSLAQDDTWEPGDNYTIQYKLFNQRADGEKVKASIFARYADGEVELQRGVTTSDGWTRIRLITDSTRIPEQIFGVLTFNPSRGETLYLDSVALVRTRNIPETYGLRSTQRTLFTPSQSSDPETEADNSDSSDASVTHTNSPVNTPTTPPSNTTVPAASETGVRQAPRQATTPAAYRPGYEKPVRSK